MSRAVRLYLLALIVGVLPISAVAIAGCGGGGGTTKTVTEVKTVTDETTTEDDQTTGEETTSDGGEETTVEEGVEEGGENGQKPVTLDLESFQSPSGNIGCILFEGNARCDIDKHGWTPPPRPASCSEQVDYGQGLTVEREAKQAWSAPETRR